MSTPARAAALAVFAGLGLAAMVALAPDADPMMGTAPAPTTLTDRTGCVTADCHPGIKDYRFLHGPVHVNACDSCHTPTDAAEHAFTISREREQVCSFCHMVEQPAGEFVHEPFAQGECLSCHNPHGSPERALLRGAGYAESCSHCHTDATGAHTNVHGPVAAGACGACHEPHSSPHKGLLAVEGRDLCLRCHVTTGTELESMHVVHEPVLGDCRVCHDPHATDQPGILHDEPAALCTACHADIARTIGEATTQHSAVTTEQSCLNCHAPHASNHEAMLEDDAVSLCFDCHGEEIEMPDGRTLSNMKAVIDSATFLHGPVADGDCTACHEIHGGGHERLLTQEYPSALYYPYDDSAYALCFSCHDKQLALLEETEAVTGFRNGTMNLHYVHVHKDNRGRSCRICHESHAAEQPHYLKDTVPYGPMGWDLPIGFTPTEVGGSCNSGCHKPYAYDRVQPIQNDLPEGDEAWRGRGLVPGGDGATDEADDNEQDAGED